MAIVRWDPFDMYLGMHEDLNRLFRKRLQERREGSSLADASAWSPAIDIYETEDALVVEAEIPGVDPKNIDVNVDKGTLSITGERKFEKEVEEENYYRVERSYGKFSRFINLPKNVDADSISATCDDGVLQVVIPREEPEKPKSIPVEVKQEEKTGKEE